MSVLDPFDGRFEMTSEEYREWVAGCASGSVIVPLEPAVPDWQTKESAFLAKVDAYAKEHGFLTYHTWKSANSSPGFPDLILVRGDRCLAVELKVPPNKPTKDQWRWLEALGAAGIEAHVWYPDVWELIEEVLA